MSDLQLPVPEHNTSDTFEPKSTVGNATTAGIASGAVGAFVSTIQNALGAHNRGATGVFTRTGGTIGFFAAMGATFAATEAFVANQREVDDALNGVAGGCAAGFLAGIRSRSLPMAVGGCAILGATVGTFDYAGRSLAGNAVPFEERRKRFFKQPKEATAEE